MLNHGGGACGILLRGGPVEGSLPKGQEEIELEKIHADVARLTEAVNSLKPPSVVSAPIERGLISLTNGASSVSTGELSCAYKNSLLRMTVPVVSSAGPQGNSGELGRVQTGDHFKKRDLKVLRFFRCGEKGHFAKSCRNALVCFTCNKLGNRSWQCKLARPPPAGPQQPSRSTTGAQPFQFPINLNPISPPSHFRSIPEQSSFDTVAMASFKKFNDSPEAIEMVAAFKMSVVLLDQEGWGRDRVLAGLRQVANFSWKVSDLEGGGILAEGPV